MRYIPKGFYPERTVGGGRPVPDRGPPDGRAAPIPAGRRTVLRSLLGPAPARSVRRPPRPGGRAARLGGLFYADPAAGGQLEYGQAVCAAVPGVFHQLKCRPAAGTRATLSQPEELISGQRPRPHQVASGVVILEILAAGPQGPDQSTHQGLQQVIRDGLPLRRRKIELHGPAEGVESAGDHLVSGEGSGYRPDPAGRTGGRTGGSPALSARPAPRG